jgi:hypothetical protein
MEDFQRGPFSFTRGERVGPDRRTWEMRYGREFLAGKTLPESASRIDIAEEFDGIRADFIREHTPMIAPAQAPLAHGYEVRLVKSADASGAEDGTLGRFLALAPIEGLSAGLINSTAPTWLVADSLGAAVAMGEPEFMRLKDAHAAIAEALQAVPQPPAAHPNAWIAELLPDAVLGEDPAAWRAPSSWELRHVVGEWSFTGISGAGAAALVGVTPQNFRKYTALDSAKNRQQMSFAMWHLLLHRLGVKLLEIDYEN